MADVRGILLDIEGTTSSVRFVYDVLFPFALDNLEAFVDQHWLDDDAQAACRQIAKDAGYECLELWCDGSQDRAAQQRRVIDEVRRLMAGDVKATGLKELQGLIWRQGFDSGTLVSHVYPDVPPALADWNRRGIDVRIYSSGSVAAQRLFFSHTEHGDLLGSFRGHYDTTTGPKREAESYRKIAADVKLPASAIMFFSDIFAELDAAREAGMQTRLVIRPGNAVSETGHGHIVVESFTDSLLQR